jgi:hypothetical protein
MTSAVFLHGPMFSFLAHTRRSIVVGLATTLHFVDTGLMFIVLFFASELPMEKPTAPLSVALSAGLDRIKTLSINRTGFGWSEVHDGLRGSRFCAPIARE